MNAKRKREQFTSLTHSEVLGRPINLKRVNAPANGVKTLLQFLIDSSNSPIIRMQESKRTLQLICLFISFFSP